MLGRFGNAIRGRSLVEILALVAKNLLHMGQELTPRARQLREQDRSFDELWGTDTTGIRELGSLDISVERARHGVRYQPSDAENLLMILDELDLTFSDYIFIDYGCGKGRIILAASQLPFRKVYGIEISEELAAIAINNRKVFSTKAKQMAPISVVCIDAVEFEPPRENLVVYLYNPFDRTVMKEVVANLEQMLERGKLRILVVYVDPQCPEVFDRSGIWTTQTLHGVRVMSANGSA